MWNKQAIKLTGQGYELDGSQKNRKTIFPRLIVKSNVFVGCWFHTWVPRGIRWRGGQGWPQGTYLEDSLREFPGDSRVEPSRPSNELGRVTSSTAPKNRKPIFPELIVNSDVSVGCWFHTWVPREIPGGVTPGGSGQGSELDGSQRNRKPIFPKLIVNSNVLF